MVDKPQMYEMYRCKSKTYVAITQEETRYLNPGDVFIYLGDDWYINAGGRTFGPAPRVLLLSNGFVGQVILRNDFWEHMEELTCPESSPR